MKHLLIILMTFWLIGCSDNKNSDIPVSSQELLKAVGGKAFYVTTPSGIHPDQIGGLTIRYADGSVQPSGGVNMWPSDTKLKVIIIGPDRGSIRYSIGNKTSGSAHDLIEGYSWSTSNHSRNIKEGEWLMRFKKEGDHDLEEGKLDGFDFELIFQIQPLKKREQDSSAGAGQ